MTIKVLGAPGAELMANVLAGHLNATLCELESRRFPDGESYLRLKESVEDCIVVVVALILGGFVIGTVIALLQAAGS